MQGADPVSATLLTYDEVGKHNSVTAPPAAGSRALRSARLTLPPQTKDCWIIINHKAYDVSDFLDDHPGGSAIIEKVAGKDSTEEFLEVHPLA